MLKTRLWNIRSSSIGASVRSSQRKKAASSSATATRLPRISGDTQLTRSGLLIVITSNAIAAAESTAPQ